MDNRKPIKLKKEIKKMTLEEVCKQFESLVRNLAKKWTIRYDLEDVKQVAYIGLIKAYETYDISRDVLFKTYAALLINGHLCRFYRDDKSKFIGIMSLNQSFQNDDNKECEYIDLVKDESNYEDIAITNLQCEDLMSAINKLDPLSKEIIELVALKNLKQVEVAMKLNMPQARVSRIYRKSLKKIKKMMEGESIMPIKKITRDQLVKEVRKHGTDKEATNLIAAKYGLTPSTVRSYYDTMDVRKESKTYKGSKKNDLSIEEIEVESKEIQDNNKVDNIEIPLLKHILKGHIGEYEISDLFININLNIGSVSLKKEDIFNFIAELKEVSTCIR